MTQGIQDAIGEDPRLAEPPPEVPAGAAEGRGPLRLAFARLRRDRAAMISLAVIVVIIVVAVAAPVFAHVTGHGPNEQFFGKYARRDGFLPAPPSSHFWLGTDTSGRDLLVRIVYGARVSLIVGIGSTVITIVVGVVMGLLSGYLGGLVDTLIARVIDVVLAVPYLLFAVALIAVIGHASILTIMLIIAAFGWASVARIIRGQVISMREREFIEAARSLGAGGGRIMFIDLLPNIIAPAIVFSTLLIPVSVVFEAALSYLGIGIAAPTADWGEMINESTAVYQQAWWFLVFPGVALLLTTLSFNILGDGVRDAFDPRSDRLIVPTKRKRRKKLDKKAKAAQK